MSKGLQATDNGRIMGCTLDEFEKVIKEERVTSDGLLLNINNEFKAYIPLNLEFVHGKLNMYTTEIGHKSSMGFNYIEDDGHIKVNLVYRTWLIGMCEYKQGAENKWVLHKIILVSTSIISEFDADYITIDEKISLSDVLDESRMFGILTWYNVKEIKGMWLSLDGGHIFLTDYMYNPKDLKVYG